ncbi:MAG: efflux RND transporter periplasmic adaptor subunit [Bacteroidales bacterium]
MNKRAWIVATVVIVGGLGAAAARMLPAATTANGVPTSRVTRGSLKLDVWAKGEFRASRVVSLAAPASGSSLRLVKLVGTGAAVRAGDVVMEFDPAEQHYALEQALMDLAEAEQNVARSRAELEARGASDEVILLTAGFDLRRAELDARTPVSLTSANDFKKRQLVVQEMKRRLTQTQSDVKMRRQNAAAAVTVAEEQRNRARLAADRAQQIIDSLVVKSPIDGLVVVKENRDATGGVFFAGLSLPEYRTGDTVFSGRSIADVAATIDMEIKVRVTEQERPNLTVGQAVTVRPDAVPRETFRARITALSSQAVRTADQSGPLRQFDVTLRLDQPDPRLRPGTSVRVVIAGVEVRNVLTVPRQALFQQNDQAVVYLRMGDRFDARAVKVTNWSESRVAIQGAPEGAEVALVKPDARSARPAAAGAAMPAIGGAR